MNVIIKAFSDCQKLLPPDAPPSGWEVEADEGTSIEELLIQNGIPSDAPGLFVVNDSNQKPDFILAAGDVLKLFPLPMGG